MHGPLDVRKPAAGKAAGFLRNTDLAIPNDTDISESVLERQAFRLRQRFGLSASLARTVAGLAYGGRHDH